ncbi:MAG: hypothetical protein ACKVQU_34645 [Burkholderiales bacterium]
MLGQYCFNRFRTGALRGDIDGGFDDEVIALLADHIVQQRIDPVAVIREHASRIAPADNEFFA